MWVNYVDAATLVLPLVPFLTHALFVDSGLVDTSQCIVHATISDSTKRLLVAIAPRLVILNSSCKIRKEHQMV